MHTFTFARTRPLSMLCRYEREFNHGKRPMLKAVLEQDHPASRPMVLASVPLRTKVMDRSRTSGRRTSSR